MDPFERGRTHIVVRLCADVLEGEEAPWVATFMLRVILESEPEENMLSRLSLRGP